MYGTNPEDAGTVTILACLLGRPVLHIMTIEVNVLILTQICCYLYQRIISGIVIVPQHVSSGQHPMRVCGQLAMLLGDEVLQATTDRINQCSLLTDNSFKLLDATLAQKMANVNIMNTLKFVVYMLSVYYVVWWWSHVSSVYWVVWLHINHYSIYWALHINHSSIRWNHTCRWVFSSSHLSLCVCRLSASKPTISFFSVSDSRLLAPNFLHKSQQIC